MNKKIKLKEALEFMDFINSVTDYSCYFEGRGDGKVGLILEDNKLIIKEVENGKRKNNK